MRLFARVALYSAPMACLHQVAKWINTESLNFLLAALNIPLAALTLFMAWVTFKLSRQTLSYMRERDLELDTRNGWIEIHKAMVNLRVCNCEPSVLRKNDLALEDSQGNRWSPTQSVVQRLSVPD